MVAAESDRLTIPARTIQPEALEQISKGQRPGSAAEDEPQPCKGETTAWADVVAPFQGFRFPRMPKPRVMPWAGMFRPFGAKNELVDGAASGPCLSYHNPFDGVSVSVSTFPPPGYWAQRPTSLPSLSC